MTTTHYLILTIVVLLIALAVVTTLYLREKGIANEWQSKWHNSDSDLTNTLAQLRSLQLKN